MLQDPQHAAWAGKAAPRSLLPICPPRLQQLALAQAGIAHYQHMDVATQRHVVLATRD